MKSYGTLGWAQDPKTGLGYWGMDLPPHVVIKAKRLFPRLDQTRRDLIYVLDTPEVAADIEWFTIRYPLDMTDDVRERLTRQADEWRRTQADVELILGGGRVLPQGREPARQPRVYQTTAAELAYTTGGLLLGDELGLGKTQSALMLFADPATLPAVIVVPTHLPGQWLRELNAVWPDIKGHIITNGSPFVKRQRNGVKVDVPYDTEDADVLILSYSKLAGWRNHLSGWAKTIIFDEVQELRRSASDKYYAAANIADKADRRMGLSASPIHNYGGEAYNIFEVLKPGVLGTASEFYREWGSSMRGSNMLVKDTGALGTYLRDQGLLLARTRAELGRQLPNEPIEDVIEVDSHTETIDSVEADVIAMAERVLHGNRLERWQSSGELDLRMRQATGIDKAPFVADFASLLLESERKIVMWGWHREVYNIWNRRLGDHNPVMYTGSETPKRKEAAVERFLTDPNCRIFISSLRSGSGLDGLQTVCNVGIFGELDWSPAIHHQALGRLARDGQESTAVGYYCISQVGSDPIIGGILEDKRQQAEPFMAHNVGDAEGALFKAQADPDHIKALARSVLAKAGR